MNPSTQQTRRTARLTALGVCAIALTFGLTGCSTPKVQTAHDNAVNFSRYKTFALLPLVATGAATDPGAALRLAQPAEQAARESLLAKGLIEVARDQADCAVAVRGESLPRVEVTQWGYTRPVYTRYGRVTVQHGDVDVRSTVDRKLVVEVFDNASHKQAWVGWTEHTGGGEVKPEKLQAAIRKILTGFPPVAPSPN